MQRLSVASVIANSRADESAAGSPSVTSVQDVVTDIQRRKSGATARTLARRLRIEKRALIGKRRRDAGGSDSNDEKEKSLLERQLDGSSSILNLLIEDGKELINNVSVGNNVREQRRNNEHSEAHSRRMQALEEEARLAEEKFQEINSKWRIIESFNDPLDINNASQVQREKCEELINQKNTIIAMLKKELEYEDFRFTADQEVQLNDVSILVERIDNQINIMRRAYKNQLILIESAIDTERFESMERNRKQWELLNKENEKGEVSYIETRLEKIEEHETSMIITTIEYEEKCRQLKMSLESDIQVMQQKLEELKTKCLLNSEKLNYDYHILRKRDEENISIKAQQKRKINKLQEEITNLYQTLKDLTYLSEEEILKVNGESSSLQSNIENAIKKMNHFLYMNNKKYTDLWKFNVMEAKQLMSEASELECVPLKI
nr:PREDICTED: dynein regulatory complex protein 1 [Bemisia tabaci]